MAAVDRFYRSDDEWTTIAEQLKQTPCPHCNAVGNLIRHGFLYGFDDSSPQRKTRRARRIFCSNRNLRPGCGRTFSVWLADRIRRLSLTAHTLWTFLKRAITGTIADAIRAASCHLSHRTWQRIWTRFQLGQSRIRTALNARCPPPVPPPDSSHTPQAHTIAHLQTAFPNDNCPIASFQQELSTFFV
jgi:hypothetical protein